MSHRAFCISSLSLALASGVASATCNTNRCSNMSPGSSECWDVDYDKCIKSATYPTLHRISEGPWTFSTKKVCDACDTSTDQQVILKFGQDLSFQLCVSVTAGVEWDTPVMEAWGEITRQMCVEITQSFADETPVACLAGTKVEGLAFRRIVDMEARWTETYRREIRKVPASDGPDYCQVFWDAFPDNISSAVCKEEDKVREYEQYEYYYDFNDLDCPGNGQSPCPISPTAFGLPSTLSWPEFVAWVYDTWGITVDSGESPTSDNAYVLTSSSDTSAADAGTVLATFPSGSQTIITNVTDVVTADTDWLALYELMYCQNEVRLSAWDSSGDDFQLIRLNGAE